MKKVHITGLKTTFDEEPAKEYGMEGLTVCPMVYKGHVFLETTNIEAEIDDTPVRS